MSALGYHVILRLGDDRVIAPSRAERRRWARQLAALARRFPVLAWKLADTHLHVVILAGALEFIRQLRIWVAKSPRPGVPLEVQRTKPLAGQGHLVNAFHYTLRQDDHHGVTVDLLQDSSSVLDLLGLRVLTPELPSRVREHLPRLSRPELLRHLGVATLVESLHPEHLGASCAAAFGLDELDRSRQGRQARAAAVSAARELGPARIAHTLEITPQAVCRLARAEPPAESIRAVRLQMSLHAALLQPRVAPPAPSRELPAG